MDKVLIAELLRALKLELIRWRFVAAAMFVLLSFAILGVGYLWPHKYTTSVSLYSDVTNIIEPLLKGRASVTEVDHSAQAREIIYGRSILEAAGRETGKISPTMTPEQVDRVVRRIRDGLWVKSEKANYFSITYTSSSQDDSFETLYAVTTLFINYTERKKREESMGAFNFIDAQVQSYKRQLELAEERLKEFKSNNLDGTEASVSARIAQLRIDVETLNIAIEESQSRIRTIKQQLDSEGQYLQAKGQLDDLRARRARLSANVEQLLLSYQESYPDVVSLRAQINEIDTLIAQAKTEGDVVSQTVENPLYEELRKQVSLAEVELRAQLRRKESLEKLMQQEHERAQRVAANQAQLSELTRDYNVTRDVYEEMLQRKESARLSMTLDQEGQGVTYRIQDPATFPLRPSGIHYAHFAAAAPLLGFLAPFGILILVVLIDPHYRSTRILQQQMPPEIPLVGVVPHYDSPLAQRLIRKDVLVVLFLVTFAMVAYIGLALYWYDMRM
ncbi:XrtA system polysaccharide chain length determinant [Simiduia agarivorans]|uniref:Polysaccharide chain length determinant protein n=1 Tax=Simiduia agarivorans (strain DSM 21679 / JCM 13881 / BCRC 17597 / SA1) TaxID=1117647 RepID=K4KYE4_SIMAS|nr:XrtA system polysaccharide chain length determinant [Simiduia agarivorans]AFU98967.1 polysaccharide chain length determinant protein [Simiduia agarivorans SA1 = DSM 21679]